MRVNEWHTDTYQEVVPEDPSRMDGFMDILSNAQAGHTIQLWLMTNGYAFSRNVECQIEVYTKIE